MSRQDDSFPKAKAFSLRPDGLSAAGEVLEEKEEKQSLLLPGTVAVSRRFGPRGFWGGFGSFFGAPSLFLERKK